MIRVRRDAATKPDGFDARSTDWRRDLKKARKTNPNLTVSKFWSQIRPLLAADAQVLLNVFAGKCAYCEAHMQHVSNPHIEHYRPKSRQEFEALVFIWENWLISCGKCNQRKWAHFPMCGNEPCLLDPTGEDPDNHIFFNGAQVSHITERGRVTIDMLGLDRSPLEDQRETWLLFINSLILLLMNESARAEASELLIWSMQPDAPYSAMVKTYIKEHVPQLVPLSAHVRVRSQGPRQKLREFVKSHAIDIASILSNSTAQPKP
jgi:uncharacterized protein (TIGR02646 family)